MTDKTQDDLDGHAAPGDEGRTESAEEEIAKGETHEEQVFHSPEVIFKIAAGANVLSWVVAVLTAAQVVIRIVAYVQQTPEASRNTPDFVYSVLYPIISLVITGVVFFILLQAVSQLLYVLMDIERNTYLATPEQA
jgi:hypothetical protein